MVEPVGLGRHARVRGAGPGSRPGVVTLPFKGLPVPLWVHRLDRASAAGSADPPIE